MASNVPKVHGLDSFLLFVDTEFAESLPERAALADYIQAWLWAAHCCSNGAKDSFGDFEIFLKTVALIVDRWHLDPTILDFGGDGKRSPFQRRAASAFGDDGPTDAPHAIFDRDNFTTATFVYLHIVRKD